MASPANAPARDVLTQEEAAARAARVSNCRYALDLDFLAGAATYKGRVTITFDLSGDGDLFFDHRGKTIHRLTVNGRETQYQWNNVRLTLPAAALATRNEVVIEYEHDYDHTGDGLHYFKDPEDGEEYLYTNFEPYEAHRLFPCFDQPDIKAAYTVSVTAPAAWEVIANGRETAAQPAADGRTLHRYEETKPFSTYLFAIIAGPYQVFRDEHQGIPLGLYCRKALAKYFDPDELFTLTKQGFDFYNEFFAYPYPFGKYDQVWVPEFNAGAMENVGAVTFTEHYVFRDPPTDTQRKARAETLLHEMAHMWFGDLVTMRWWNDLWLNESFASYMSYLAMVSATRFTDAWAEFNAGMKNWAYRQDQLVTTHPIAGQVRDTEETFLNFDGITYGKGASVLKQLVATIGLEGFREGMRRYMQRYQFNNATLAEFLRALEDGSGRELSNWAKLWLETPSLNTLGSTWESDGERITRLAVTQTAPPEYPTIRPHQMEIGLLRERNGSLEVEALPFHLDSTEGEVEAARGKAVPSLVFPNYNDHAYAKIALDGASVAWVRDNLDRVSDPLMRQLLWQALWDMTRDQQLPATEFVALAGAKIQTETHLDLVESVLGRIYATLSRYIPDDRRAAAFHDFFTIAWNMLHRVPEGDPQITWARAAIGVAISPDDARQAARLADGQDVVPGFTVDQDMRWDIAIRYVILDLEGAAARVAEERRRDPSDRGDRAALRAETAAPTAEAKARAWERINGEGYGSMHQTVAAMSGFWSYAQREMLRPYIEPFFEQVVQVYETKEKEYAQRYFNNMFPSVYVERPLLERSERLLTDAGGRFSSLDRQIKESNDDLQRAIRCREFAARS